MLKEDHAGGWLKRRWLSFSLEKKIRFLTLSAAAVVLLSIFANVLVAGFGIGGFGSILERNSDSLAFWSAIDRESQEFTSCIREGTPESRERYERASENTKRTLEALPSDYNFAGAQGYAKVWSIRNMYECYTETKDKLLSLSPEEESYTVTLASIYRMQGYLSSYAGKLEQIMVEQGAGRYEALRPMFFLVPGVSFFLGAVALFVVIWLNRSVKKSIIRPVVELAEDSARIGQNDFSGAVAPVEGEDEIARLVRAFVSMKGSTEGYIRTMNEKHEVEIQLDAVRLQMLKNQINPHFLFNTLNMIASTAQIEDAATTEKMITALGRLFRYNLKSTDTVMPLERELKVVQDYMYLQQMRFGQRLRYTQDCSEDTLEVLIPAFSLQPLVENAVIHGLSSKSQGGRIHIRSRMEDGDILISVADTGVGISQERLAELRQALDREDTSRTGIGLGNIYRRVHSMYADGHVLVDSVQGYGTVIRLRFKAE